jgi:hypothetical protein
MKSTAHQENIRFLRKVENGLASKDPDRQIAAFNLIRNSPDRRVDTLRRLARAERRSRVLDLWNRMLILLPVFAVASIFRPWFALPFGAQILVYWWMVRNATTQGMEDRFTRLRRALWNIMPDFASPETAGPMLLVASNDLPPVRFQQALRETLQSVRPEDAVHLTAEERKALRRLLSENHKGYVLGALAALEQIGNAEDIPALERFLASSNPVLDRCEARARGSHVLQTIRERMAASQAVNVLMRPASTPTDSLLVVAGAEEIESRLLLRSSEGEP